MRELLLAMVHSWNPDWGAVFSTDGMEKLGYPEEGPFVQWIVFLNKAYARLSRGTRPPVKVELVKDIGTLITVMDEPPNVENPEHLSYIAQVRNRIKLKRRLSFLRR